MQKNFARSSELNQEFGLQLSTDPVVDRLLHTPEVSSSQSAIIVIGGSHASRLADKLGSTHPEVVDLSISGLTLSDRTVTDIQEELEAALAALNCHTITVVAHLYDNCLFKGSDYSGAPVDPIKQGRSYHIEGDLQVLDGDCFKEVFDTSLPLLKATKGHKLLLVGPLPRYVTYKCCDDDSHITNYDNDDYIDNVAAGVKERGIQLKNLVRTRRIACDIVVPLRAMGLDGDVPLEDRVRLWGSDPVHPSGEAYGNMAAAILELAAKPSEAAPVVNTPCRGKKRKADQARREEWTGGSEQIAPRLDTNRGGDWARGRAGHSGRQPTRSRGRGIGRRPRGGHPARGLWKRGW